MRTFFLDLASHDGLLAAVDDAQVVASKPVDHRTSDSELVPLFEALLREASWSQRDIERVACVTGPGGFTSLRVAAAFANALAYALHVPAAGIHLSDLYAMRATACHPEPVEGRHARSDVSMVRLAHHDTSGFLWLHSTKKTQLFARGFGTLEKTFSEAALWNLEDLLQRFPADCVWTGELIPAHNDAIANAGSKPATLRPLHEVLPALLEQQSYSPQTLEPWYGRGW